MKRQPTTDRYSTGAILFHWGIALLILVNLALGFLHEAFGKAAVQSLMAAHKSIGLTILGLSVLRLGWRLAHPVPALPVTMPFWQVVLARTTHAFFYIAMIVLPLTGWAMVSASTKRSVLEFFGLFSVPYLPLEQGRAGASFWHETHEILALALLATVGLHIAAALKHHFYDRNEVLVRIFPKF